MKLARLAFGAALAALATACDPLATTTIASGGGGGGGGGGGAPLSASVTVGDNFFDPTEDTVAAGGTVTWHWTGANPHSVVFDDGAPGSAVQDSGSFSRTFTKTGLYTYFSGVDGRTVMSGDIVVQ